MLALMDMAEDADIDPQTIADTAAAINADFEDKADGYAKALAQLKADITALKAEKTRISDRIASKERAVERLSGILSDSMKETGKTKFKTPLFSFWIQKNPPSVRWVDGAEVPERFLIPQEPKRDAAGVLKALKAGEKFDFAEIAQTEGVRIR